jgi:hypothetical protein
VIIDEYTVRSSWAVVSNLDILWPGIFQPIEKIGRE